MSSVCVHLFHVYLYSCVSKSVSKPFITFAFDQHLCIWPIKMDMPIITLSTCALTPAQTSDHDSWLIKLTQPPVHPNLCYSQHVTNQYSGSIQWLIKALLKNNVMPDQSYNLWNVKCRIVSTWFNTVDEIEHAWKSNDKILQYYYAALLFNALFSGQLSFLRNPRDIVDRTA